MMKVSVTVKNTFVHCAFDEETDGTEAPNRGCSRSKSMERMTHPDDKAAMQMSKLGKILQDDKEAVRNARAPISASPKEANVEPMKDAPPPTDASPKRPPSPEQLLQLRDKLDDKLDRTRKWSSETGSSAVPEEDTEIRPSLSNSSVSTMTSFEANRSRTSSNDTSNGSISTQTDEFKQETVQMTMNIEEEPHRPNQWHSTWYYHDYHEPTKWKPKRNHDFASKPNYAYNKSQRWDSWGQDSSSGESMMGSTFTTPTPSPKFTKDMMHGQWGMNKDKRNLPRDSRHNRVPRNVNLQEEYQSKEKEVTTLMIRNIPNRYTQRELISELEDLGFAGTFDFLYSPLDKGTMSNVGYAFVNFKSHEYASKCIEAFHNYRFKRHRKTSGKVAAVSAAHLQGLEANLAHYEKTAVNTAKMKQRRPVVLANISSLTA